MTPDQLTQAIVNAFVQGGEQFLEGTMAAALPLLWMLVVALHLARPYMVRTTQKFSLRLGADIWWVLYVGLRDVLIAATAILSFMFLYPDVIVGDGGFGTMQARIPKPDGEIVITRYTLHELLDKLGELTVEGDKAGSG